MNDEVLLRYGIAVLVLLVGLVFLFGLYRFGITLFGQQTSKPVSYTHLDVYKRKVRSPGAPLLEKEIHARRRAPIPHRQGPFLAHRASVRAGFAADDHPADATQIERP